MTTPQLDRLQAHGQRPRLSQLAADLPTVLEQAAKQELAYTDFLEAVLSREVGVRSQKHLAMRIAMARFPFHKPQLLVCDEIGYLPIDRHGANLFFHLVSRRYERGR